MRDDADVIVKDDYVLLDNTSEIYKNGSKWHTNKYGDIRIIGLLEKRSGAHIYLVEFEDGTMVKARHTNIKNGRVKNPYHYGSVCGVACLGLANSKHFLYSHWNQMIRRCYDKNHIRYFDYGGRGIRVCKRWLCFEYFLEDMSKFDEFEKLNNGRFFQIDRIDNDSDYCLDNCRIVSASDNSKNKRNSILIMVKKDSATEVKCLLDVSREYNIDRKELKILAKHSAIVNGVKFSLFDREDVVNG